MHDVPLLPSRLCQEVFAFVLTLLLFYKHFLAFFIRLTRFCQLNFMKKVSFHRWDHSTLVKTIRESFFSFGTLCLFVPICTRSFFAHCLYTFLFILAKNALIFALFSPRFRSVKRFVPDDRPFKGFRC